MNEIRQDHYSGINFDWVVVRELRFIDNPEALGPDRPKDMRAELEVEASVHSNGAACTTALRLILRPPSEDPEQFEIISATVEGHFSATDGEPAVPMDVFSETQAPAILMPFLRQQIALVTSHSRFGQILVPPLNVGAIMRERQEQQKGLAAES